MLERTRLQAAAYGHAGRSIFLASLSLIVVASAHAQAPQRNYEIPAQPLAEAVTAFGQQSGTQISAPSGLLAGRTAAAIKGNFSMPDALARLLAGTGVTFAMQGTTVVLQKAVASATAEGAYALGNLQIEGQGGSHGGPISGINGSKDSTATEGSGSYTTSAISIGKTPLSQKETPLSVSVITQQQIADQNITDFTSLMQRMPGVSAVVDQDPNNPNFFSRGFLVTRMQVDGGAPVNIAGDPYSMKPQIDMALYDHAELHRGADGLFDGYGSPGGVLNLERKRALNHNQVLFDTQYGSWAKRRASLDVTGPLAFDGKLRGRAIGVVDKHNFFYDVAKSSKDIISGTLELDVWNGGVLSVGATRTWQDSVPFMGGLPRYLNGDDLNLPRDTCLCVPWGSDKMGTTEYYVRLESSLGENWNVKANISHNSQSEVAEYAKIGGGVDPVTKAGGTYAQSKYAAPIDANAADVTANGTFTLWGKKQRVTVGANYMDQYASGILAYADTGNANIDLMHFDPYSPAFAQKPTPLPGLTQNPYGRRQYGAYVTATLNPIEKLYVNLGTRYSHSYQHVTQIGLCAQPAGCDFTSFGLGKFAAGEVTNSTTKYNASHNAKWPPDWSVAYDVTKTVRVYGSFQDIYQTQDQYIDVNGDTLGPITGKNVEAGLKWASADGLLNASMSLFHIVQDNEAISAGTKGAYQSTGGKLPDGRTCCWVAGRDSRHVSRGVDLEVAGEVTPGWQVTASYNLNLTTQKGLENAYPEGTPLQSRAPVRTASLWSTYQLPQKDWMGRLNVGLGIKAQSSGFFAGKTCGAIKTGISSTGVPTAQCNSRVVPSIPFSFSQGGYAVLSSRIAYDITHNLSLSLTINNLLDRKYYQTVLNTEGGNWYGEPRSVLLGLTGRY